MNRKLKTETERLRQQLAARPASDIGFLEVEPSNSERAAWPDQTRAYVESLEQILSSRQP